MGIDSLAYDLVADCPDNPVKLIHRGCAGSGQIFKVTATPTTFFINRGSVISDVCIGFSMRRDSIWDAYFYSKIKNAEN